MPLHGFTISNASEPNGTCIILQPGWSSLRLTPEVFKRQMVSRIGYP